MVQNEPLGVAPGQAPSPPAGSRSWRAVLRWLPIVVMLAVFLDAWRYDRTWARGPLGEAYWNAAAGLAFAFSAWHAWNRRGTLPARPDWRLDVAVQAFPAAWFLYLALRGYAQVLGS